MQDAFSVSYAAARIIRPSSPPFKTGRVPDRKPAAALFVLFTNQLLHGELSLPTPQPTDTRKVKYANDILRGYLRRVPSSNLTRMEGQMRPLVAVTIVLVGLLTVGLLLHLRLGLESTAAWGSYLTGVGTILLGTAAVYAAIQAVREYKARTRMETVRWTTELFHKFYEEGHGYRLVRQKIDYDDLSEIFALIHKSDGEYSQEERDLLDKFTDYLNFFEYIAYLLQREQLNRSDVDAMFEYYLRRMGQLKNSKELGEYIKESGDVILSV